ncbi:hypothetical protein [Cupriavidus nantongensis]|uniref:hypothetical protein n=1 Tax=Cupriavidus nantongensis TaxID=1796606 RepID=UPI0012372F60|nr:hypothetical protein [Cupriavidus nantongensis]
MQRLASGITIWGWAARNKEAAPAPAAAAKKKRGDAALLNGLTDTGSVLQVEETASMAMYVRRTLKTIEAF